MGMVSATAVLIGDTRNALPGLSRILGDARSFDPAVSTEIEEEMHRIAAAIATTCAVAAMAGGGGEAAIPLSVGYPGITDNDHSEVLARVMPAILVVNLTAIS